MIAVKYFMIILVILMSCQGCGSKISSRGEQNNSKLVDLGNGICRQDNGLMWQIERSGKFSSFEDANNYLDTMDLGGYNDWRFPTKDELYMLSYLFEMKHSGDCPLKPKGSYWSKNGKEEAGEWYAYPLCGGPEFQYLESETGRVRAVRP